MNLECELLLLIGQLEVGLACSEVFSWNGAEFERDGSKDLISSFFNCGVAAVSNSKEQAAAREDSLFWVAAENLYEERSLLIDRLEFVSVAAADSLYEVNATNTSECNPKSWNHERS